MFPSPSADRRLKGLFRNPSFPNLFTRLRLSARCRLSKTNLHCPGESQGAGKCWKMMKYAREFAAEVYPARDPSPLRCECPAK
jgi:hypothetical protein